MTKFVLVHGAFHGGWCWDRLVPELRVRGHEVHAPDLPGMGGDKRPFAQLSMADWTDSILVAIRETPGPAVLVAHSRAGAVASAVAEAAPELVERIIYLSAIVVADGQTALEAAALGGFQLDIKMDEEQGSCTLTESDPKSVFYGDCADEDALAAVVRLCPEPLFALTTKLHLTPERFGRIPRDFIECAHDRVVSPEMQKHMQTIWPMQRVRTLNTSHSPFFSQPEALANVLVELAAGSPFV